MMIGLSSLIDYNLSPNIHRALSIVLCINIKRKLQCYFGASDSVLGGSHNFAAVRCGD